MMRRPVTPLAFVVALLAERAAGAQHPPPLAVEHRPPEARTPPAPQPPRVVRPGQSLPFELILRWPHDWREMRERRRQIEAFEVRL